MFKLRQRSCLLLTLVLILLPCVIVLMFMGPELSTEQSLSQRLGECHMRLQYLESMYRTRQEDVTLLSQYLMQIQNSTTGITATPGSAPVIDRNASSLLNSASAPSSLLDALSAEARQILRNASQLHSQQMHLSASSNVRLPTAYHFLPHLSDDPNSLRPALLRSRGRSDVSIVLGIPTVVREKQSYLLGTLHNLIENMNEEEQNETLIIVYIGESDEESVQHIAKTVEVAFEPFLESGLIEILAPSPSYYPNFEKLRITLNDSLERVKWRSKQNLDFAYLMAYAQSKALLRSRGRSDVSIVLGIPTVVREKQSYLLGTLHNLIENMNEEEQNETLIIVHIGESDEESVQHIAKTVEVAFEPFLESGLIEILAPSPSYYPNFEKLRITLNDSLERVKWRSKQNLDFAYLMAYAQSKGTFYVQLEDDILAKRHFITTMKKFAITKSALTKQDQQPWFLLDFCQLGFIGKMFKSAELPYLITYFQMFFNDKPVDWLLAYFIESKVCRNDIDQKHCNQEKAKYWLHYRPSLFQHIGTSSSLKGKVQKLKDKQFGSKVPTFYAHAQNPSAQVKTNIAPYKNYQLKRAYRGETYFWGLLPQPGDLVQFDFDKPTLLKHYLFRSGNSEHPSDRFYNTTVEVLPADTLSESSPVWSFFNSTTDGYLIVGSFDNMGVAEGSIDTRIGAIKEIRLHVHGDSENWALLSEIDLQAEGSKR